MKRRDHSLDFARAFAVFVIVTVTFILFVIARGKRPDFDRYDGGAEVRP